MRRLLTLVILAAAALLLVSPVRGALSAESTSDAPPIAQSLVRQGDFAVSLAEALSLGVTEDEAVAESRLADSGVAPRNGWIADYPVTPDIIDELHASIGAASESGRLRMSRADGLRELNNLAAQYGLPIPSGRGSQYAEDQTVPQPAEDPTARDYTQDQGVEGVPEYPDQGALDDYYSTQGPPVVTYYDPPEDYGYLYSYVPYPFWWSSSFFPGFFVLNDFHTFRKVVTFKNHRIHRHAFKRVTNHVFDRDRGRHARLDPVKRLRGDRGKEFADASRRKDFRNGEARRGAESILRRGAERGRLAGNERGGRRDGSLNASNFGSRNRLMGSNRDFGRRGDDNVRGRDLNTRGRSFQGQTMRREMNRGFENRSNRFENRGLNSFSGRSGGGDRSFGRSSRGMRDFRTFRSGSGSRSFRGGSSSGRSSFGRGSFSSGDFGGHRGFSGKGGFSRGGGGFSGGSGSFSRGGGSFSRGGGGFSRGGGGGRGGRGR